MQTLLDIHSRTKGKCRAEYNTDFSLVYLVEDFQLLLVGQLRGAADDSNLLFRNTCLYQFLLDILVQIESAVLVLIVVSKDCYGSIISLCLFQAP